jgi:hypothetical protein
MEATEKLQSVEIRRCRIKQQRIIRQEGSHPAACSELCQVFKL